MKTEIRAYVIQRQIAGQATIRLILIAAGSFLLGAGASALWLHRGAGHAIPELQGDTKGQSLSGLSDTSKTILSHLKAPVEIRFYSLVEPGAQADSLRSLSGRVDVMLKAYEEAAGGKLKVKRFDSQAYSNAGAATADGVEAFANESGNPSFLGITVVQRDRKKTLPQLSPEWEIALESDLSRAISEVSQESGDELSAAPQKPVPAAVEEVKRILPNYNSISLEDGTRMLREAALQQFKDAATELQSQLRQAEQALSQAQTNAATTDQQAAMKHLQQLQAEQTERLKQIAANSQVQIEALRRLKSTNP